MSEDLTTGTVRILAPDGSVVGTGFVVTDEGLIATCAHVVESDDVVGVVFHETGTRQQADVLSPRPLGRL